MLSTNRVLITGGRGLIAGRLAEHFQNLGFQVRLGTRYPLDNFERISDVETITMDWQSKSSLLNSCRNIDVVVNAMGMNASDCINDPPTGMLVNGVHTASLLRAAIYSGAKRFIHFSTAHVYGNPLLGTISESSHPTNLHPYATSHRSGEDAVLWAAQQGEIEGVVLRLSNAFGRPISSSTNCWMLLVNDLCRQAVESKVLTLRSDGTEYRDFIPLRSVCRVLEYFCKSEKLLSPEESYGHAPIFNIGSGNSKSVFSMAKLVKMRSNLIFPRQVKIIKMNKGTNQVNQKFQYKTKNLQNLKYYDKDDTLIEIDELLNYCVKNFSI